MSRRSFLLTLGATVWWIAHLWKGNFEAFSSSDLLLFLVHASCVLVLEYLLLVAVTRALSGKWSAPLNALFCTFNFYTTVAIHSEQVASLSVAFSVLLLLACSVVFLMIFLAVEGSSQAFRAAMSVVLVLAALNLARYAWKAGEQREAMASVTLPTRLTLPEFADKPNVYFLFFDAMIPHSIARRFLALEQEPEYVKVLREAEMRLLDNVFADYVPTLPSISAFIALDFDYFESMQPPFRYLQAIGAIPGPLYEIFKRNGYKTQLIYRTNYFGSVELAKLDHYGVVTERGVCYHVDSKHALLGYCLRKVNAFWSRLFYPGVRGRKYPQMLIERISETARSADSWMTIAYVLAPKHAPNTFSIDRPQDWAAYAKRFEKVGVPRAAQTLRQLLDTIDRHDPGAVVVIMGDHGALLSRGHFTGKELPRDSPLDAHEVFLDQHAVLGAVRPADFCPDYFRGPIGVAQIARDVVKCLSRGQDPLPAAYRPHAERYRRHAYE